MVPLHPIAGGEALFDRVRVFVNGVQAAVQCCRVSAMPFNRFWPGHQRTLDQTELAGFVSMDMSESGEPAYITVLLDEPIRDVWLRPLSKKVFVSRGLGCADLDGNSEVNFTLTKPGQYVLEINDHHCPIMFFVNPTCEAVEDDGDVLRFGPGEHHPGVIRLKSNQTLLIEKGAVVYASVSAEGARNVRVTGGGILDNSEFPRYSGSIGCRTPLILFGCEGVEVSNIIIRDPCAFAIRGYNLRNVHIDNVKIIGCWRYNSDGIDLYNSQNVVIENCFVRTYDDSIVIKAQKPYDSMNCENWIVRRCVVWNDWGHALEIGAETRADEYRNILFTDCDIIHHQGAALDVSNNGDAYCHDIVFDDIRLEYKTSCTPQEMQDTDDSVYSKGDITDMPALMRVDIPSGYCHPFLCGDGPYGKNRHIVFRNIQAIVPDGMPERVPRSYYNGHSATEDTKDIVIEGLYVNGERVTDIEQANIHTNEFASDIIFS